MHLPLRVRRVRLRLRPSVLALLLGVGALLSACGGVGGRVPDDGGDLGVDASVDGAADLGVDEGPPDFGPDRFVCPDDDGDGVPSAACGGSDCDDLDPSRFPGAIEVCDADDEDCDDATVGPDADGDGEPYFGCCNGPMRCGSDCDDTRRAINAGGIESCNGFDDDCDGRVDEEVAAISCADTDGDGRGPLTITEQGCRIPLGATTTCNDCDDANPQRFVGATELCNGVDDNCNLAVDEACECGTGEARACGSTTGECRPGTQRCLGTPGLWEAGCGGATGPVTETCDGLDNDCDGRIDEGVLTTFFADCDADGFGDDATTREVCERPLETPSTCDRAVWVLEGRDCDDADPSVNVEARCLPRDDGGVDAGGRDGGVDVCTPLPEACNGIDDDCDGRFDEGAFGPCGTSVGECVAGVSLCVGGAPVCTGGSSPEPENCNGLDDDCNGFVDDGDVIGAGFRCGRDTGECVRGTTLCVGGVIACDGEVRSVPEVCNGRDDDCDGARDEDLATFVRYLDFDGDGYGLTEDAVTRCEEIPGWVAFPGDCNDGNISVYPGMGCSLDPDAGIPDAGFDGGIPDLGFDGGIPDLGFDGGIPDLGFDGGIPDLGFDGGAPFDGGSVSPDGGGAVSARAPMPSPRAAHACAWMADATNPRVLVWGGFGSMPSNYAPSTVLAYDPVGDTWSESAIAAPIGGRVGMGTVWTGSRFFVWGGVGGIGVAMTSLQDGFLYDPAFNMFLQHRDERRSVRARAADGRLDGVEGLRLGRALLELVPVVLPRGWRPLRSGDEHVEPHRDDGRAAAPLRGRRRVDRQRGRRVGRPPEDHR